MEAKLLAVFTAGLTSVNVTQLCADLEISRQSFYKYRRRFDAEGPAGLVARSRAPRRSPQAISIELEDEIVRLRKTLRVDHGAQMIAYHLARDDRWPDVPAVSTIHRVLVRRGLVTAEPRKRPKSATTRFVWPRPNDAWQIDATMWALADGSDIWIMDVLDDHSRVLLAARVCQSPTTLAAWDALSHAAADWGLPAHVMSDNGTCFTNRLNPHAVAPGDFECALHDLGIRHIPSSPAHPQTCGKLERSHQTSKRWLDTQDPAETAEQLQDQLDIWRDHYNFHRPHRALHGATPAQAWHATPRATPGDPITTPATAVLRTVRRGRINYTNHVIGLGAEYDGCTVLVIARDHDLVIHGPGGQLRRLTLTPDRRSYPQHTKPGGRKRARLIGPCH